MADNLLRAASSIEIVDANHHLWDLGSGHYPWLQDEYHGDNFFLGSYERLRHDYLAEDYRRDTGGYHIVDTVHIEAERSRGEQVKETAWLHDQRARTRLPGVVVAHFSFTQPDLDEVFTAHTQILACTWYPLEAGDLQQSAQSCARVSRHVAGSEVARRSRAA